MDIRLDYNTNKHLMQDELSAMLIKTSRWAEFFCGNFTGLFFPKQVSVCREGIKTKKTPRWFMPWQHEEQWLPYKRVLSIRHQKGLLWDSVVVEVEKGLDALKIRSLSKASSKNLVEAINGHL